MSHAELARVALAGRVRKNRVAAAVAALCLLATGLFWYVGHRPRSYSIAMTAGDVLGHRHELAVTLQDEAARHGLEINLRTTAGSQEALSLVSSGVLDVAQPLRLRRRLTELKSEALEKHAEGVLKGEEQMICFLAHVTDVRSYLESLFAHESRQLGKQAEAAKDDGTPTPDAVG